MSKTTDMTVGSPFKHLLLFTLPLLVTHIGQQLYMIADASIVGRGVGVQALAAVGATDWSYWLILWSVVCMTQAFATFTSRYFGDKDYTRMNKSIAMSLVLTGIICALFTVVGLAIARPILHLLNTPADIMDGAAVYLMTMIGGILIVGGYNMTASILRALGDGRTPLIAMLIAALLNIGLDCLFVFVFRWGILGAAAASVASQLVSLLYCAAEIRKVDCIRLDKTARSWDPVMARELLRFGIPVAMQLVMVALGGIVLQSSVNLQGSTFIAGYTATNKVYGLLESSAIALGMACTTFFAQNYGARRYTRIKQGMRCALLIVLLMAATVSTVTLAVRRPLLSLFLNPAAAEGAAALDIAVHYLTIMVSYLLILYLIHVFRNVLQGMGIAKWSFFSGVAEFVCRVTMSKAVIHWMGRDALFVSEPVSWLACLLCGLLPYFYYRKKLLKEEVSL